STGVAADHREPVASSRIPQFLDELEAAIGQATGGGEPQSANAIIRALASDLAENTGKGLIYVGPRQPAAVHARVHRLNGRLENLGQTVVFTEESNPERPPYAEAIAELAKEMNDGNVETLLILRGNPAYDSPADVEFAAALQRVPNAIHLSEYRNETTRHCRWYLPGTHAFEQWGDGRTYDGTLSIQQPLIAPLHGGRSELEVLAMLLAEGPRTGEQIVRETFGDVVGTDDTAWKQALHDGFVAESAPAAVEASAQDAGGAEAGESAALADGDYEIVFCESEQVYDGRFANNGWLQEVPAFLTKLTWDNAAILSYVDATKLGVEFQDVVRISFDGRSVELPVYVWRGLGLGSIAVGLGEGREAAGLVGGFESEDDDRRSPVVGVDAYALRTTGAMNFAAGVRVEKVAGRTHPLATTQDHFAIDPIGRNEINQRVPLLVREGTETHFHEHPDFVQHAVHHPPLESLWTSPDYSKDHAWGMAIDLSKCVGCNACVVACQSENNVPIVGKQQVLAGREMHWMRIDRYFRGNPEGRTADKGGPVVVGQPVLCMHCEHAPCEQVCPVAAAVHDHEGLNLMVYNRCVGTRYCNNNCPYKVRRFNYFNWNKQPANKKYRSLPVLGMSGEKVLEDASQSLAGMVFNPEVTVRSRGVMEKCTYCQQRIAAAKIEARNHNVHSDDPAVRKSLKVQDGAVQTACQQTCPTDAIVFGDLLDETSRVYKLHYMRQPEANVPPHPRSYAMLEELNVRPRTAYLARIKNPHPSLADIEAYAIPPLGHASGHHDTPGDHAHEEHGDEEDHHG
nr:4Fe-4S dicluster domain-containing protein [Planctomycetota bacterium]